MSGRSSLFLDHEHQLGTRWIRFDLIGEIYTYLIESFSLWKMQHATVVVDEKLYIVGGSRNGRYLSDVQVSLILCLLYLFNGSVFDLLNSSTCQVFDLRSLTWDSLKLKTEDGDGSLGEAFPAISDHRMVKFFLLAQEFLQSYT